MPHSEWRRRVSMAEFHMWMARERAYDSLEQQHASNKAMLEAISRRRRGRR